MPFNKKEYQKKWKENNKEKLKETRKQYYEKNKEIVKETSSKYYKTDKGKKHCRIKNWKSRGIIFFDYDVLYDIYMETTHCDKCECELNQCTRSRKCMDHDHSITDIDNVRNVLCHICNCKRG